jgi:ABC-type amino acid transport system permease subunit
MSDVLPAAASRRVSRRLLWPLMAVAVVVGGLMAVAVALWLHYGTAVFFEIVRAGIAACL